MGFHAFNNWRWVCVSNPLQMSSSSLNDHLPWRNLFRPYRLMHHLTKNLPSKIEWNLVLKRSWSRKKWTESSTPAAIWLLNRLDLGKKTSQKEQKLIWTISSNNKSVAPNGLSDQSVFVKRGTIVGLLSHEEYRSLEPQKVFDLRQRDQKLELYFIKTV